MRPQSAAHRARPGPEAPGPHRARRPESARAGAPAGSPTTTSEMFLQVASLEDRMRAELRRRRKAHARERDVFVRACRSAGAERIAVSARNRMPAPEDFAVSGEQFVRVWKQAFGVDVGEDEAAELFRKYGQTESGRMPCTVFADALLVGRSRLMGINAKVQRGAFEASPQPKAGLDIRPRQKLPKQPRPGGLKIIYPECRKGVFTPSSFSVGEVALSSRVPDARLELEHVYGYAGLKNTSTNLFYDAAGRVVYYTAAVGVVLDPRRRRQRFFLGHTDDVTSIAMAPDRAVVATGQVTSRADDGGKANPYVCVWDTDTCAELRRLEHEGDERSIVAMAFSPDGRRLLTVTTDNNHTVHLWDWRAGRLLSVRKGKNGVPPQVYGAVWSALDASVVMTYGVHHVAFWKLVEVEGAGGDVQMIGPQTGDFNRQGVTSVLSAVFLSLKRVATGVEDGSILIWGRKELARNEGPPGFRCLRRLPAHRPGPVVIRPDGARTHNGVRALLVLRCGTKMVSGGADGVVIVWALSEGTREPGEQLRRFSLFEEDEGAPPAVRALDSAPDSDAFIAGTNRCDIWEVDETPSAIIDGHQGEVRALAAHPKVSSLFATASMAGRVYVWDGKLRALVDVKRFGDASLRATSLDFSPLGDMLAVGFASGGLKILAFPSLDELFWTRTFTSAVDVVRFSPDGRLLAAGSHDAAVDVFDVSRGGARVSRCKGHSSTVTHIDWSTEGSFIMTNSMSYEILYFDARHGRQVLRNMNDVEWHSWTCTLGFPVMGIWPEDSDGTDVNAVARSRSGAHLVSADDFGRVNLFNYPVVVTQAPCRSYRGHSSHVMNIAFTANDKRVISVGGKDRAVFQVRAPGRARPAPPARPPGRRAPRRQFRPAADRRRRAPAPRSGARGCSGRTRCPRGRRARTRRRRGRSTTSSSRSCTTTRYVSRQPPATPSGGAAAAGPRPALPSGRPVPPRPLHHRYPRVRDLAAGSPHPACPPPAATTLAAGGRLATKAAEGARVSARRAARAAADRECASPAGARTAGSSYSPWISVAMRISSCSVTSNRYHHGGSSGSAARPVASARGRQTPGAFPARAPRAPRPGDGTHPCRGAGPPGRCTRRR